MTTNQAPSRVWVEQVRVLHVDDEASFAETAALSLEREDERLTVETAAGASEALDRLGEAEFDCVVSDYDMPGRNGIELLEAVRREHPDLPFVLYTGRGSEAVASEAISAGVTDYFQKEVGTGQYTVLANRIVDAVAATRSATDTGVWEWDLETDEVVWSESLERAMGLDPGEFEGTFAAFREYVHPEDRPRVEANIERTLEADEPYRAEFRMIGDDGAIRWIATRGQLLDDDGGRRMVGVHHDITDKKERERELERYRTIVETTDDIAFVVDEDRTVAYANESIEEYIDAPAEELEGQPVSALAEEYVAEEYRPAAFEATLDRVFDGDIESDEPERLELGLDLPAGEVVFEYQFSPVVEDGSPTAVVVTIRDITDRKRHERELQRERDRFEEFAGVVSHDLRNPLNVARARIEHVRETRDDEHLATASNALDRMDELIEDVLTLTRRGEEVTETRMVDLGWLAEQCWENIDTAGASLAVETDRTVLADRSRLQQLIENLVCNAIEHGGENVTVTVGDLPRGFYVEDDGPGIPPAEREDVFDLGYSTARGGTGFGLNIVEQAAEAHGWDVRVTEGEGGGARFEITGVAVSE